MSTPSEEDRFADALHRIAGTMPVPSPAVLYDAAVRRGRSIRRRRAGVGFGAGVALCAVATLAVLLPGGAAGRSVPVAVGTSGSASTAASATASPGGGPSTEATAASTSVMVVNSAQALQSFTGLLPSSAVVVQPFAADMVDAASKLWVAQVTVTLQGPGNDSASHVDFSLYGGTWARSCAQASERIRTGGSCTTTSLAGGTLFTFDKGGTDPTHTTAYDVWLSPDGYTTELAITDVAASAFELTTAQIEDIVTADVWATLIDKLPHH